MSDRICVHCRQSFAEGEGPADHHDQDRWLCSPQTVPPEDIAAHAGNALMILGALGAAIGQNLDDAIVYPHSTELAPTVQECLAGLERRLGAILDQARKAHV